MSIYSFIRGYFKFLIFIAVLGIMAIVGILFLDNILIMSILLYFTTVGIIFLSCFLIFSKKNEDANLRERLNTIDKFTVHGLRVGNGDVLRIAMKIPMVNLEKLKKSENKIIVDENEYNLFLEKISNIVEKSGNPQEKAVFANFYLSKSMLNYESLKELPQKDYVYYYI